MAADLKEILVVHDSLYTTSQECIFKPSGKYGRFKHSKNGIFKGKNKPKTLEIALEMDLRYSCTHGNLGTHRRFRRKCTGVSLLSWLSPQEPELASDKQLPLTRGQMSSSVWCLSVTTDDDVTGQELLVTSYRSPILGPKF